MKKKLLLLLLLLLFLVNEFISFNADLALDLCFLFFLFFLFFRGKFLGAISAGILAKSGKSRSPWEGYLIPDPLSAAGNH